MGIMDFIKGELIDVIEWTDDSDDRIVYRFPDQDHEIKMGAQLTVRESQAAIFVNEGQIADVFCSGRYELTTQNMPVLTTLKSWKYGFESPFKAEVYFVNTRQFTDQKWGTANPIIMRDAEFGMVRLRAFGIYSFRVTEPAIFLKEIFGTHAQFDTESITGQLRRSIVSGLSDMLGEEKASILDLAANYDELSERAIEKLQPRFTGFGLRLETFYVENISLPEEVEKNLDKRTSMGVIGHMGRYAQYQTAEAIRDAAQNEGGGFAGAGVGLGAGAAMGKMMSEGFNAQPTVACPKCSSTVPAGAKFCPSCGHSMAPPKKKCVHCGAEIGESAKFCPECGQKQALTCAKCGKDIKPGAKFCPECGEPVEEA
jgi:membrane protease subunit (stomatin/prohibitin family)